MLRRGCSHSIPALTCTSPVIQVAAVNCCTKHKVGFSITHSITKKCFKKRFRVRDLTPPTVAAKAGCLLFQAAAQEKPIHFRRCLCCIFPTLCLCCNFYPLCACPATFTCCVLVLHCNFYPLCACAGTSLHCKLNSIQCANWTLSSNAGSCAACPACLQL